MTEIEELKAKLAEYEKRMGIGKDDPAIEGYLVLIKLLRQQNDYLNKIEIKNLIVSEEKGKTNEYERAKGLWEKLPSIIQSLNSLRVELKIDGEQKVDMFNKPISPQSIALNGR